MGKKLKLGSMNRALLASLLVSFSFSFALDRTTDFDNNSFIVGPAISQGDQGRFLDACAVIDYMLDEKEVRGWPFVVIESAEDDCAVFFRPEYKFYPAGMLLNFLLLAVPSTVIAWLYDNKRKKG